MIEAHDPDEILATVSPSAPRRALGMVVLCTLGGFLLFIALARPAESLFWQLFLIVLGTATLYLAAVQQRATSKGLELTREVPPRGFGAGS